MSHFLKERKKELTFTTDLPTKEGYYWWTNFGEHTPTVLYVRRDTDGVLWGGNEEFTVVVKKPKFDKDPEMMVDGYYYGQELWCYIPCPMLPNGKQPTPDCY
jgi:hypothetical protein